MRRAVALSERGMELGHGGPFGAVIVKDGAIYWSRIGKVYFAITRHDAAGIEFRDELSTRSWRSRSARESCPWFTFPVTGCWMPSPPGRTWRGTHTY